MDNSAVNQPTHERISQIEMEKRLKEADKQEQFLFYCFIFSY